MYDQFFGLPSEFPRSKQQAMNYIVERIEGKMSRWKKKLLSKGGKEVLIKSISTVIPIFSFHFPLSLCNKISSRNVSFFWGQKGGEKKLHWVSWTKMCESKYHGGIGFKDMKCFNKTLVANQGW